MRSLLAATALLVVMGATPSMARDYACCSRTSASGFNPSCSFTSYNQCMATVSGQRGECVINPRLAFAQEPRARKRRAPVDRWDGGDWTPRW
jgi:hypothetical protein